MTHEALFTHEGVYDQYNCCDNNDPLRIHSLPQSEYQNDNAQNGLTPAFTHSSPPQQPNAKAPYKLIENKKITSSLQQLQ